MSSTLRKHIGTIVAVSVTALVIGGIAVASIPDSGGVIRACYAQKGGTLRVIDTDKGQNCKTGEVALNWNQKGVPGADGATGPAGSSGPAGSAGLAAVEQVTATAPLGDSNNGKQATAICPQGKRVISGGYRIIGQAPAHVASDENEPTAGGDGWHTFLRNEYVENGSGWGLTVTAVCALVQP